jgi:hemerythrin superfamily protein
MSRSEKSAVALLKADHREVEQLFEALEDADGTARQATLASQIGQALTTHAELEETFLYPRVLAVAKKSAEVLNLACEATVGTARCAG